MKGCKLKNEHQSTKCSWLSSRQVSRRGLGSCVSLSVMHFRAQLAASVPREVLDVKGKSGSMARLTG